MSRHCGYCLGLGYVEARDYDANRAIRHQCPNCRGDRYGDPRYHQDYLRQREEELRRRYEEEEYRRRMSYMPKWDGFDIGLDEPQKPKPKQPKDHINKETTSMTNYSTAVMLFNENIRAVKIVYEPQNDGQVSEDLKQAGVKAKPTQDRYVFKTLDPSVKVDDYVIVPTNTRHGMTVVRVAEVDVEVDFDSKTEIKWLVGKVDRSPYDSVLVEESVWIETMKKSEKRAKKEALKKNMMEFVKEEEVKALAITHMGGKKE